MATDLRLSLTDFCNLRCTYCMPESGMVFLKKDQLLSVEEIVGTGRSRRLVSARQIGMYLCRELTDMPLIRIGEEFGGRDHTTVMHANKKISELMKERRAIFNQVTELTARIKSSSSSSRQ